MTYPQEGLAWKNNYTSRLVCKIIKLNTKSPLLDLTLNQKFRYIFLSSGQASKQAGPYLACWLAQIKPFSFFACSISNQTSKPVKLACLLPALLDSDPLWRQRRRVERLYTKYNHPKTAS